MPTASALILLIDDELPIRRFLVKSLAAKNYRLIEAETGEQAIRLATQQPPDLVILDLGLPDMDGQEVLKQLRQWLRAPIIVLSARDQESHKVTALDNGADDYLTKPFSTGELLARIRVALRHSTRATGDPRSQALAWERGGGFASGDLKVDLAARQVFVKGEEVHLTPLEYKLLNTLINHAGKVLTHRFLLQEVWGPNHQQETHYLRIFMASLRRKIEVDSAEPRLLLTEQGIGYRLAVDA